MARPGPWKWTEERKVKFIKAISSGHSRGGASEAVGVDRKTVQRTMAKDVEFRERVETAEGGAVSVIEAALFKKAKSGHVTAMIFYLCNRATDRWTHANRVSFLASSGSKKDGNGATQPLRAGQPSRA